MEKSCGREPGSLTPGVLLTTLTLPYSPGSVSKAQKGAKHLVQEEKHG